MEPSKVYGPSLVQIPVQFRENPHIATVEVRQRVPVDMEVGEVGYEVVADQEAHQDPVVYYPLDVVLEREFPLFRRRGFYLV